MKFLIYILIILNTGCQQQKIIFLEKDDFSLSYPSHLKLDDSEKDGVSIILATKKENDNDNFIENVNLVVKNIGDENFIDFTNKTVKQINDFGYIKENKRFKINNKDCLRLVIEATQNNIGLTFIQHYYVENGKAYVLTFSCETKKLNKYFNEMNEILLSFKIK